MTHLGDITKIDWFHVPPVDVVTGGSPCQDLSVAGKRAGLAGERSGLYMEQIRCVKELRQADEQRGRTGVAIRPRYMVWENVPGAFSSNGGKDFAAVLEEAVKVVCPESPPVPVPEGGWPTSGCLTDGVAGRWSIAWRVHDAQFWGVPQRRRRISVVCDFGGQSAPEVLFERKGVSWDSEQSGTPGEEAAGGTRAGTEGASRTAVAVAYSFDSLASNSMKSKNPHSGCRQVDVAKTLDCFDPNPSKNQGGIAVVQKVYDARGNGDWKTVCTLTGDHQNRVMDYMALIMRQRAFGDYAPDDVVSAIKARDHKDATDLVVAAVDCRSGTENYEGNGTLQAKESGGTSLNLNNVCRIDSTVRRLTPLECERLQGYPDGWTDIGEWVDSKGKRHKDADSPRYKALGNSIALPFWFWLLRRISAQYIGPATLGSLFDGISGFCYVWARCNGSKSCLWASEIEEFPIAVCKRHFGDEESGEVGDILEYL